MAEQRTGYNIKVRLVENGYTIHYSEFGGPEWHKDLIARDEREVEGVIRNLHREFMESNPCPHTERYG